MVWQHSDAVVVKRVKGKGRGVFARRAIPEGTVFERVPVLVIPLEQVTGVANDPVLMRVCFMRTRKTASLALGYGSIYNHSFTPNAEYEEGRDCTMAFRARRAIAKGEEITINYNGEPDDLTPVGFEVR